MVIQIGSNTTPILQSTKRWWSTKRLGNLPKVTQLVSGRAKTWIQAQGCRACQRGLILLWEIQLGTHFLHIGVKRLFTLAFTPSSKCPHFSLSAHSICVQPTSPQLLSWLSHLCWCFSSLVWTDLSHFYLQSPVLSFHISSTNVFFYSYEMIYSTNIFFLLCIKNDTTYIPSWEESRK